MIAECELPSGIKIFAFPLIDKTGYNGLRMECESISIWRINNDSGDESAAGKGTTAVRRDRTERLFPRLTSSWRQRTSGISRGIAMPSCGRRSVKRANLFAIACLRNVGKLEELVARTTIPL